ncbi:hypothetical protein FQR65_LT16429 [Abscondita terminalis]|nr:hypothetical protein FQR65_LT16429 [Abscondita terminalis]
MGDRKVDFLIIGSGIAGLSFALKAAKKGKVLIVTKSNEDESNTKYAQGGLAMDYAMWKLWKTCREGPERIAELIAYGTKSDKVVRRAMSRPKEGGHSKHRILHYKDITGYEIERALLAKVHQDPNIEILTHYFAVDLITQHHLGEFVDKKSDDIKCFGIYALNTKNHRIEKILSRITLMASGGRDSVLQYELNPTISDRRMYSYGLPCESDWIMTKNIFLYLRLLIIYVGGILVGLHTVVVTINNLLTHVIGFQFILEAVYAQPDYVLDAAEKLEDIDFQDNIPYIPIPVCPMRISWFLTIFGRHKKLDRAFRRLGFLYDETEEFYKHTKLSVPLCELRKTYQVAFLVIKSAQDRKESRGLHYSTDYPYHADDKYPQYPEDCFIAPNATIVGDVVMGDKCSVWFNAVIRGDVNYIRIGAYTNIQDGARDSLYLPKKRNGYRKLCSI